MSHSPGSEPPPLDALDAQIRKIKAQHEAANAPRDSAHRGMGMALRLGVELVAGVAVGAGAGILLDRWLGTTPLLMLVCLALGTAAGVKNLMQTAARAAKAVEDEERQGNRKE